MKPVSIRHSVSPLRWVIGGFGIFFIIFSVIILVTDLVNFSNEETNYPVGVSVQGIPLGGLSRSEAEVRLQEAFSQPVELHYGSSRIQFNPSELGFTLDAQATLDQIEAGLPGKNWWKHLWGGSSQWVQDFPVQAVIDETTLRELLIQTIPPRYDQPATAAMPILYSTNYTAGTPGLEMDLDASLASIRAALFSPAGRVVDLVLEGAAPLTLDPRNLEVFLKQAVQLEGFDGLVEIYLQQLPSGEALHFAVRDNQPVAVDVAYSAASTIKIPIMASVFNHLPEPTPEQALTWMERMIVYSENPPADSLMSTYLEETTGPLIVTQDMADLGYQNTFLAGYFYSGAPMLRRFTTPANSRTDVYLDPDFYNQTVPSEIGDLLKNIYLCAHGNQPNQVVGMFAGSVTAAECQQMLDLLGRNQIGLLIEAGLPPEGSVAHKHGWTSDLDGLLHTMSDAGIVSTPAGDYVLIIFINSSSQLVFSEGNWLFAKLSQTIYNAFNLENQAAWLAN
ncbi:MAG: serine hydrolase [Anaerolineaceae bacterium]